MDLHKADSHCRDGPQQFEIWKFDQCPEMWWGVRRLRQLVVRDLREVVNTVNTEFLHLNRPFGVSSWYLKLNL